MNDTLVMTSVKPAQRQLSYQELDILHALRGFCAFYVVIAHAKFVFWSGGMEYLRVFPRSGWHPGDYLGFSAAMLSSAGPEMVIFFFVLSGFFIRFANLRKHRSAPRFYLNRIVRIYPPYLFSMALAASVLMGLATWAPQLLNTGLGREFNANLLGAWQTLRTQPGADTGNALLFLPFGKQYFAYNGVYWSLLPEALFYLAVPLAFWRITYYYLVSLVLFCVGLYAQAHSVQMDAITGYLLAYNAYFALGSWLYDILVARPIILATARRCNSALVLLALAALQGAVIILAIFHFKLLSVPLAAVLAVVATVALLAGHVNQQNMLIRAFHGMGIFSFSLYLYHGPLLQLSYGVAASITGQSFHYGHWYWLFVLPVVGGCYALYYVTERVAVNYFRGL